MEYPTVSVTARLTGEEYWAMPGVHSVQGEMTCHMEAMLECYNGENPDSKYRGIQDPDSFTMEQISCLLRVIEECRFSYREICPEERGTTLTETMRMWSLRPEDVFTTANEVREGTS